MAIPMRLDTIQYRARPLGKLRVKNPSIRGIIQSIMVLVEACLGSVDGIIVIFCCAQVVTPTSIGIIRGEGSGLARSSHRKLLFIGTAVSANGLKEYRRWDSPTRWSGVVPIPFRRAW